METARCPGCGAKIPYKLDIHNWLDPVNWCYQCEGTAIPVKAAKKP